MYKHLEWKMLIHKHKINSKYDNKNNSFNIQFIDIKE